MNNKFHVVTLCGSTRFKNAFEEMNKKLTLEGNIVISVGLFGHSGDAEVWEGKDEGYLSRTKQMLDDMHKSKIDMADSIFVINPEGYIGNSTWSEICYAYMTDKNIDSMFTISEWEIQGKVEEHIHAAERFAFEQIDGIRHSDGYYDLKQYTYFKYKGKEIVDPWISVETHYDGTPWIDHEDASQKVNPFKYYGKKKVARFIENILQRRNPD